MMNEKEKTTVPIPSVGADGEQSLSYVTNEIIATGNEEINPIDISLLIEMGYSAVAIADRVGHESINITYNYAHLFPSTQSDMADKLNQFRKDGASDVIKEQGRA